MRFYRVWNCLVFIVGRYWLERRPSGMLKFTAGSESFLSFDCDFECLEIELLVSWKFESVLCFFCWEMACWLRV